MKKLPWDIKISKIFSVLLIFAGLILQATAPSSVFAQPKGTCSITPSAVAADQELIVFEISFGFSSSQKYKVSYGDSQDRRPVLGGDGVLRSTINKTAGTVSGQAGSGAQDIIKLFSSPRERITVQVLKDQINPVGQAVCATEVKVLEAAFCPKDSISIKPPLPAEKEFYDHNEVIEVSGKIENVPNTEIFVEFKDSDKNPVSGGSICDKTDANGNFSTPFTIREGRDGAWSATIGRRKGGISTCTREDRPFRGCEIRLDVGKDSGQPDGQISEGAPADASAKASQPQYCNIETGLDTTRDDENAGIRTAIGCIPIRNTTEFVGFLLRWSIGIAGGIAFLLMLFAAFQIMTSTGNPERLQGGRELLTAAISGLILIIFSVFLLRLIGFEILQIPGFKGN